MGGGRRLGRGAGAGRSEAKPMGSGLLWPSENWERRGTHVGRLDGLAGWKSCIQTDRAVAALGHLRRRLHYTAEITACTA